MTPHSLVDVYISEESAVSIFEVEELGTLDLLFYPENGENIFL
jgi:hypothetical protein